MLSNEQEKKTARDNDNFKNQFQTIQGITRVAKRGHQFTQTTIDVIFTNCYSVFVESTVLNDRIGYHQAIMCKVDRMVLTAPKIEKKIEIRNYLSEINRVVLQ